MKIIKIVLVTTIIYIGLIFLNTEVLAVSTGIAENETIRLRKDASTDSSIVTLISMNEKVEILSEKGNWYKVKYISNGKTYTGYVRKDMLKVDNKKEEVKEEENKTEESTEKEENVDNTEKNVTGEEVVEIKEGATLKTKNILEMRILPLITSNKTEKIDEKSNIMVTEIVGNWCHIVTENKNGWIMKSQIENTVNNTETQKTEAEKEENKVEEKTETKTENKELYVEVETVNLRRKASSDSDILEQLSEGTKVTQLEKIDNTWSKVKVNGMTGYIASEYLTTKKPSTTSRGSSKARDEKEEQKKEETEKAEAKKEETKKEEKTNTKTETKKEQKKTITSNSKSESSGNKANKIVSTAKKYLGYRYVSGGSSPETGFDCSGFTSYVYKVNGYSINRTSSAQALNGKKVSKSNLQPGDLVLFRGYSGSSIGHVGIYIGGNKFIHAANSRKGVITTSLSDSYYAARYVTARRIIN